MLYQITNRFAKNTTGGFLPFTLPSLDSVLGEIDKALKTLVATPIAQRTNPSNTIQGEESLTDAEKTEVIGLMRVNHVGEICAQALYQAQAMTSQDPQRKALFQHAAREETDHLAWTQERLSQLDAKPSLLNPFWYSGAFALGFVAGQSGEKFSLGFMAETEKQVERHLNKHLRCLPISDQRSRAILEQMKQDEIEHGQRAMLEGAHSLPLPVKLAMAGMSKIMTVVAKRI